MSTIIDFDTIVRRFADPSAPVDASVRQAIAEGGVGGLVAELQEMLEDGEICPELEEQARELGARTLRTAAKWNIRVDDDDWMYSDTAGWRCYLVLDPRELDVYSWSIVGAGEPGEVYHKRCRMLSVRVRTDGAWVREQLESEQGQRILAGVSEAWQGAEWDGSNMIGRWDWEMLEGIERDLERLLEEAPMRADADFILDWWGHSCESLASTFAEIIAGGVTVPDAIRQLTEEARDMDVILDEETMRDAIEADIARRLEELTEAIDEEEDDDERAELGEELVLVASAAKALGEVA